MKLTIFTPCYNRANCLPRLYESLIKQTFFGFEWLIVDDGSTDNTKEIVHSFDSAPFPIRYIYKENGGKHTAYNLAVEKAAGELFFCVDSDDLLAPDAVEVIIKNAPLIKDGAGILALKCATDGTLLSDNFPEGTSYAGLFRLNTEYGVKGELSIVFKTEVAKRFPFPTFHGERFVSEAVVYDRIDRNYEYFLLPKVLTVCEYLPDGYSASAARLMQQNPCGFCLYFMQRIDMCHSLSRRIVTAGKYHAFRIFSGKALAYDGKHHFTVWLSTPLGRAFRLYYKLFRNF